MIRFKKSIVVLFSFGPFLFISEGLFGGSGSVSTKKFLDLLMCTINFSFGSTAISFQFQVSPIWGLFLKLFRPFRAIFQNPRGYLSRSLRIFLEFGLDLRRVLTLTNVEYPF